MICLHSIGVFEEGTFEQRINHWDGNCMHWWSTASMDESGVHIADKQPASRAELEISKPLICYDMIHRSFLGEGVSSYKKCFLFDAHQV